MHQPFRDTLPNDAYGAFEFRARSDEARALVANVNTSIERIENRQRRRKAVDTARFYETVERFVGELLQAKAKKGKGGTGRFGRAMSARGFSGGVVGYDNVVAVRDGLERLRYLIHTKGYPNYHLSFDKPGEHDQGKGEAAKFEATPSLVKLARKHGVTLSKIHQHFPIEHQPIEARRSSHNDWQGKRQGSKVRFEHTPQTLAMEARVVAINEFLEGFKIAGADHRMLYRLFNECDDLSTYKWNRGGRLYSDSGTGEESYQSMSTSKRGARRSNITIAGERVVELDIAASYLTIFHALAGQPLALSPSEDPYARIDADRDLVKGFMTVSFGAGKLSERWSSEFSARYADEHRGVRPSNICTAKSIADKAVTAYPLLRRVGGIGLEWSNLMFAESEAIMLAIEVLMRRGVPSLPMHDALIVRASDVAEGATALYLAFHGVVGVLPVINTKSKLPGVKATVEAVWGEVSGLETRPPQIDTGA
jgi:hypothetical protein